jgi:hypothetical protein
VYSISAVDSDGNPTRARKQRARNTPTRHLNIPPGLGERCPRHPEEVIGERHWARVGCDGRSYAVFVARGGRWRRPFLGKRFDLDYHVARFSDAAGTHPDGSLVVLPYDLPLARELQRLCDEADEAAAAAVTDTSTPPLF